MTPRPFRLGRCMPLCEVCGAAASSVKYRDEWFCAECLFRMLHLRRMLRAWDERARGQIEAER